LPGPCSQIGVVDPAVLEEAILDMLIDRHDRFDVFEVIKSLAVADLVQGPDGDQVGFGRGHFESPRWCSAPGRGTTPWHGSHGVPLASGISGRRGSFGDRSATVFF